MSVMDGIAATRELVERGSGAAILILTTFDRDDFLFETLDAGASGFLLKTAEAEKLIKAVQPGQSRKKPRLAPFFSHLHESAKHHAMPRLPNL